MTDQLAPADPEVREFEATVESVDGNEVVLDRTYFYAESGGQPADRGTLGGVPVVDVQSRDGDVVHALEESPGFDAGATVTGVVDDQFRTYCMRAHTASHALYGAGRRLLDDLGYGGFDIGEEKVRVDFTTPTDIDDETLVELERLTNRVVWDSLDVSWAEYPADEARDIDGIAFNTKTEEGVMADADAIRVVRIEDWDVAACGGTHVANTREIGPVEVLSRSNPGEGLTRVEFAVGPSGIRHRHDVRLAAETAARALGTSVPELPEMVESLRDERDRLEREVRDLKDDVLDSRLAALETVERDGATWLVGAVEGFGPNEVADRLKALAGERADVVAVAGEEGSTFVAVASTGTVDAGDVVGDVTDEFGGGGGGSPRFAQGGGLSAAPDEVVEFLYQG